MTEFIAPAFSPAYPEIFLAIMAMILLMLGVSTDKEDYRSISRFSILSLIAVGMVVIRLYEGGVTTFGGMFVVDGFSSFMKVLVLFGAAVSIGMATRYARRERIMRFEYPVLILFSTLGMMLMISANDLMALYMGLELQSLPLYVLAAMQRDSVRSTEAGLKYFILGALSSGILLYGMSLLYGYTGTTQFAGLAAAFESFSHGGVPLGVMTGMVLLMCGMAFKISAVPFHMWTPDVYEGSPTSVTAFFAIVPKIAALALMARILTGPFGNMVLHWQQVIILLSVASMVLGAVAAIGQRNIKRMLAYSSIGHMGYALSGLCAANQTGVQAVLVYAAIYMVMSMGAFAFVLMMKRKDRMVEDIYDLSGLSKTQPMMALGMAVIMFSMAGIPPLAGFFGKLYIFQAVVNAQLYMLAVIGVLSSVVAAYYYLRVIKVMYFDAEDEALDAQEDRGLNLVMMLSSLSLVTFILVPAPLITAARLAAETLLR
ncbi:MAG: NADH-quinone oxidoreductase subunit NuoN [Alphaproteobacteria bacterium]|nr:NADH-quinone oxidoreductase subunit NuoN [Alphaproteobacteria bacterium]